MSEDTRTQADTTRSTVPQHILDRFENAWQQMRLNASASQKPSQSETDKR
jgi:hypothetical protein